MDDLTRRLMCALDDVLFGLHPVHSHTAFHSGGIGGQAMTPCCHVLDGRANNAELETLQEAEDVLREAFLVWERE